jgi:hypothetical protein
MTTEQGRVVLERVLHRVREVAPTGLGHWSTAWDRIAEPGDRFLDTLRAWEANDTPDTREALQAAADSFVRAWKDAAIEWDARGRPIVAMQREAAPV